MSELDAAVAALPALPVSGVGNGLEIQHLAGTARKLEAVLRTTDGLLVYQVDWLQECASMSEVVFSESRLFDPPQAVATIFGELFAACQELAFGGVGHVITDAERESATRTVAAVESVYAWWKP